MSRHVLFLVSSVICLALGSVLTKYLLSSISPTAPAIDPLPFLTLQLFGGVIFVLCVRQLRRGDVGLNGHAKRFLVLGGIVGAGSIGTIMALALISASEASLVFATQPILILCMAWVLLQERSSRVVILLALIAMGGVVLIVVGGQAGNVINRPLGLAFAVFSTICAALYTVLLRRLSSKAAPLSALLVVQSTACLVAGSSWAVAWIADITPTGIEGLPLCIAVIGTGALYYGAAFFLFMLGLEHTEASKAGMYFNLVPVFTLALAYALLSERMTSMQWIGALSVLVAVSAISYQSCRAISKI